MVPSLASGMPIQWNRVNQLPGFVYFDHAIHVNKGVGCESCHGRVDTMTTAVQTEPLTMGWCLDCHRNPAPRLRPRDQVTRMDWTGWREDPANRDYGRRAMVRFHIQPAKLTDCNICHR